MALWRDTGIPRPPRLGGVAGPGVLYAGNSLAFMVGLARIPASLASLIFFTYPVVTVLLARAWLGERLTRRRVIGIQWIGPARAAIFSTLEPTITVALATVVLGERLLGVQIVGGALILLGMIWLRLERSSAEDSSHQHAV